MKSTGKERTMSRASISKYEKIIIEKIKDIIKQRYVNIKNFANVIGLKHTTLYSILVGDNHLKIHHLGKILKVVDYHEIFGEEIFDLTDEEQGMIEMMRGIPEIKSAVMGYFYSIQPHYRELIEKFEKQKKTKKDVS